MTEDTVQFAQKRNVSAGVRLIPWDPENAEHTDRLHSQRVACGWNSDMIQKWRGLQREGKKAIHWIVLSEDDPTSDAKIAQHVSQWPEERNPLFDTAASLRGVPRVPSRSLSFVPIGHISLDSENREPTLANEREHLYCITTFFISPTLQSYGIGRAAMDAIESMSLGAPLHAKALAISTVAKEHHYDTEKWIAYGRDPPKVCEYALANPREDAN
ncbi:hypothetical protein MMC17_004919 [Xylographa soralifera]|nr:hypothetical protein [Xylographa soralifera]